jgi:16S rRNA (uracil1498-N3)-methyltransferase
MGVKKVHRFFVTAPLHFGAMTLTDEALAHQLLRVLHVSIGEQIIIFNSDGFVAEGAITDITKKTVSLTVSELTQPQELGNRITLYAAILKNDNFEIAVQKAVETGVTAIVPITSARTVKSGLKHERLVKIIQEAAEQSGRVSVPELSEIKSFTDAVSYALGKGPVFVFDPLGVPYASVISSAPKAASIFIGPEGGFTDEELRLAKEAGAQILSLGNTILRGETAVTVATFLTVQA